MWDHGCETLPVIGWWYWDCQWDVRPWVWDIACYWLVVLGLSVGCETMGVRHCLLLAGGIGAVSGMWDHGCETLPVIGWWYWDCQWDVRPRVWDIACYWLVELGLSVGCETMGVRHCLLLAGGIGTVSGMWDHGCETLPVIGWWYWDCQWDVRPWVWDIACYWLVVLGLSVGCETMGVRHCLLLAGGIGTVSGMWDHGCETLRVIGWWNWDCQWDVRPWVWDTACYWLVVLGLSVGCETMGVRHCLLLAGGIGAVSGMWDHGCETLPVIGWWNWDCQWDVRPRVWDIACYWLVELGLSVGCETMGVRHCLLLAGGIGTVSGMWDHGCETLPVIGWWYWDCQWDVRPWVWDIACYWLVVLGLSVGCETMGVRHCLLLAGGIGTVSGMWDHGCETLRVIGWWNWDCQWDVRPWVWDTACYWLVVLGLSVGCETMGVRHCLLLAGGIGTVSGMWDHGCETLPVIGWWYWDCQWDVRPWVWDIACYWLVVLGLSVGCEIMGVRHCLLLAGGIGTVSGMWDHGCETLPVIGWWYWDCHLDVRPWVWDIGLSTHPGTGVDGANGRGWNLADFLLKHV